MSDTPTETPPDEGQTEIHPDAQALLDAMHLEPTAANVANATQHVTGSTTEPDSPPGRPGEDEPEQLDEPEPEPEESASTGSTF